MTSSYETETNLETKPTRQPIRSRPTSSEAAYERLTGYGFAQRYAKGKTVANVGWEEIGYGSHLLAETAESVAGLTNSPEAADQASAAYSAPNVSYHRVNLPELPYSETYFDTVVAFGVVEDLAHPEDLVGEAKRVLKKDGVLVISALDKQTQLEGGAHGGSNGLQREMYVPEFRELLERHFGLVHVYRLGAVAGGCVFPVSDKVATAPVKSARFSLTNPDLGAEPPRTRCVIAVCTDAEEPQQEEEAYLLLDRDRRVFDECEERAEDVELMQSEIRQMQETEVQAFLDALRVQQSLYYILKRYPIHLRNIIHAIRTESRMYRRVTTPYRWLRAKSRSSD
jgi:SAM-dependent methyltransferase